MSEMKMNEENVNETKLSQLLGEENLELRNKLRNANDLCDKWFVALPLEDKIEFMARYYQFQISTIKHDQLWIKTTNFPSWDTESQKTGGK